MPIRSMEQGIAAIQAGNREDGARLLKIALRSPEVQGPLRATVYLWLSETTNSRDEKIKMHQDALVADPNNTDIQRRLALLMAPPQSPVNTSTSTNPVVQQAQAVNVPPPIPNHPPETNPYQAQAQPVQQQNEYVSNQFYREVGILGGPNGQGTGFFVSKDGLIATTRFVVGGSEEVTVELDPNHRMPGEIVRSFPAIDLAFIKIGMRVNQLLTITSQHTILDNMSLTAVTYNGRVMSGQHRVTHSELGRDWFPTTIANPTDAGGNPIFDDRNLLVGMLTRNANRTSPYVFGVQINTVYRYVEHYHQEKQDGTPQLYCSSCGHVSRAESVGGFYCETCGSVLPSKREVRRFAVNNPRLDVIYGENMGKPCWNCKSRVGYYNGYCLRCGEDMAQGRN